MVTPNSTVYPLMENVSSELYGFDSLLSKTSVLPCNEQSCKRTAKATDLLENIDIGKRGKLPCLTKQPCNDQNKRVASCHKVIINGKEALDLNGEWAKMLSSNGYPYYFNIKTFDTTWFKPNDWVLQTKPSATYTNSSPLADTFDEFRTNIPIKPNDMSNSGLRNIESHPNVNLGKCDTPTNADIIRRIYKKYRSAKKNSLFVTLVAGRKKRMLSRSVRDKKSQFSTTITSTQASSSSEATSPPLTSKKKPKARFTCQGTKNIKRKLNKSFAMGCYVAPPNHSNEPNKSFYAYKSSRKLSISSNGLNCSRTDSSYSPYSYDTESKSPSNCPKSSNSQIFNQMRENASSNSCSRLIDIINEAIEDSFSSDRREVTNVKDKTALSQNIPSISNSSIPCYQNSAKGETKVYAPPPPPPPAPVAAIRMKKILASRMLGLGDVPNNESKSPVWLDQKTINLCKGYDRKSIPSEIHTEVHNVLGSPMKTKTDNDDNKIPCLKSNYYPDSQISQKLLPSPKNQLIDHSNKNNVSNVAYCRTQPPNLDLSNNGQGKRTIECMRTADASPTHKTCIDLSQPNFKCADKISNKEQNYRLNDNILDFEFDTRSTKSWVTIYNFPAMLMKYKGQDQSDALLELRSNQKRSLNDVNKKPRISRNEAYLQACFRKTAFISQIKAPQNKHRLLSQKLQKEVFRIPDELWEQNHQYFKIELIAGYYLEGRPDAYTSEDYPILNRNEKMANKSPIFEDVVRCNAIAQIWKTEMCLLLYSNGIYTIERNIDNWKQVVSESKLFLNENGFL